MADRRGTVKAGSRRPGKKKEEQEKEAEPEPELPDGQRIFIVGGEWSTLRTINDALNISSAGDEIVLQPGEYRERLHLQKDGIQMRGDGDREKVILHRGVIAEATNVGLHNVSVQEGVAVEKGNLTLTGCHLSQARHNVSLHAFTNATIRNCDLVGASTSGVYGFPHSRGTVEECRVSNSGAEGTVGVYCDNSSAVIRKNKIEGHATGIYVGQESAGFVVQKNAINKVTGTGILLDNGARSVVKGNTVSDCKRSGIVVQNGAAPTIQKNEVDAVPVVIKKGCQPVLRGNKISGRLEDENEVQNPAYAGY